MSDRRQVVDIMRPDPALDEYGRRDNPGGGSPTVIASDVPASIEVVRGRELDVANQNFGEVTHKVGFYISPSWNLSTDDYLVWKPSGKLLFFQQPPADVMGWDFEVSVYCGEKRS